MIYFRLIFFLPSMPKEGYAADYRKLLDESAALEDEDAEEQQDEDEQDDEDEQEDEDEQDDEQEQDDEVSGLVSPRSRLFQDAINDEEGI